MHAGSIPYAGRAFVYALHLGGQEDLLKVGMTKDPLVRWSSFHPRWFETFDLEHSLLVETEALADAQALETRLHRALVLHRCPAPMTLRPQAGGETEWYRGAGLAVHGFVEELRLQGYIVHAAAKPWLAAAMRRRQDTLAGLLQQAHADHCAGWLAPAQRRSLQDLLDAHRALDPDCAEAWPLELLEDAGIR
jgi:hypothetical protein